MVSEQYCLKWNDFQKTILNAFGSLQDTQDLADVTLTCEGIRIKAHKIVLSACSPYFRTIFKDNPCSHPIVILKDVFYQDLIAVLNFMYQGEVLITQHNLNSFLQTAQTLQVSGLVGNVDLHNASTKLATLTTSKNISKVCKSKPSDTKTSKSKETETAPLKQKVREKCENVIADSIKVEVTDDFESDFNCNDKVDAYEYDTNTSVLKSQSILEAALEIRDVPSILERSLTLHASKSPFSNPVDATIVQDSPPDVEVVATKYPELDTEKRAAKHKLDFSPLNTEVVLESSQQKLLKIVDDINIQGLPSDISVLKTIPDIQQPHHSSQCGKCPHCGKIYSNQSALKYHVRLVHSDLTNMYCCHLCPEAFDYREGYKKHMVEAHSVRN
ncbi:hypothetical protein FQA39_LY15344 [Lamprigera yunnana]|nr:hypothetical protein FQA39_LY15344 [Lamprigera yunnana]